MIIWLAKESYLLAKSVDFSDLGDHVKFNDDNYSIELDDEPIIINGYHGQEIKKSSIRAFLGCISDEVVLSGLSPDQNKVLPRGRELYDLYDSIYYSLPVKQ